jgi:tetratricopeptide (TPR) repeat protein
LAGGYESAAKHYGLLAAAPWPEHQMRAALSGAKAQIALGRYEEALQQYESVLNSSLDTPPEAARQKRFAVVGKSVCLAKAGRQEEGLKLVQQVIVENEPTDTQLFGRAYNALGACYQAAERPKDALLAYLHVDLLFPGDPDIHAEALYHLSRLWAAVNKSDRAVRARSLLQSRYPGSLWAKQS